MRTEGESSRAAALREAYVAKFMTPVCRRIFEVCPEVQSVVVVFAPSAGNEVNDYYVPCLDSAPEWPACVTPASTRPPSVAAEMFWGAERDLLADDDADWLERHFEEARAAFLPFVPMGFAQLEALEVFAPYAVVKRGPGGMCIVEVVGTRHRSEASPVAASVVMLAARASR